MADKLNLKKLMELQMAGGVLDKAPHLQRCMTWESWTNEFCDMTDPATVEFLAQWRTYLDAKEAFNEVVRNNLARFGYIEVDSF